MTQPYSVVYILPMDTSVLQSSIIRVVVTVQYGLLSLKLFTTRVFPKKKKKFTSSCSSGRAYHSTQLASKSSHKMSLFAGQELRDRPR